MGSLVGSFTTVSTNVDLTATGAVDWIHFGDGPAVTDVNRKSTGGSAISTYTLQGSAAANLYNNDPRTVSWTDGSPTASSSSNKNGLYSIIHLTNSGFSITFPADTSTRIAKFYCGTFQALGTLTATLSDGSAAPYTQTTGNTGAGVQSNANFTFTYSANSSGQTLTLTWLYNTGGGNITINAATLASGGTAYTKAITDLVTPLDTVVKMGSKVLLEQYSITDSIQRVATLFRTLTDSIALTDLVNKLVARALVDTVGISDTASKTAQLVRAELFNLVEYFTVRKLIEAALAYFRRYILDITDIQIPSLGPVISYSGSVDPAITYFRQYLGRI